MISMDYLLFSLLGGVEHRFGRLIQAVVGVFSVHALRVTTVVVYLRQFNFAHF